MDDTRNDPERVLPWYALHTRSNFERLAADGLSHRGLETFFPAYTSRRRWSDRTKTISLPLFPGYIFCRLDIQHRLPVITTPGVVGIVGVGKQPIPVVEEEIATIQSIVRSDVLIHPWPFLRTGEAILIESGPLTGVEGILLSVKGQYRLVVSVTLLQRSVAVEIERAWVRPIHNNATRPTLTLDLSS